MSRPLALNVTLSRELALASGEGSGVNIQDDLRVTEDDGRAPGDAELDTHNDN